MAKAGSRKNDSQVSLRCSNEQKKRNSNPGNLNEIIELLGLEFNRLRNALWPELTLTSRRDDLQFNRLRNALWPEQTDR